MIFMRKKWTIIHWFLLFNYKCKLYFNFWAGYFITFTSEYHNIWHFKCAKTKRFIGQLSLCENRLATWIWNLNLCFLQRYYYYRKGMMFAKYTGNDLMTTYDIHKFFHSRKPEARSVCLPKREVDSANWYGHITDIYFFCSCFLLLLLLFDVLYFSLFNDLCDCFSLCALFWRKLGIGRWFFYYS